MRGKRYGVMRCDEGGTLTDSDGKPVDHTWDVVDRATSDGYGHPLTVQNVDTRTTARRVARELNDFLERAQDETKLRNAAKEVMTEPQNALLIRMLHREGSGYLSQREVAIARGLVTFGLATLADDQENYTTPVDESEHWYLRLTHSGLNAAMRAQRKDG